MPFLHTPGVGVGVQVGVGVEVRLALLVLQWFELDAQFAGRKEHSPSNFAPRVVVTTKNDSAALIQRTDCLSEQACRATAWHTLQTGVLAGLSAGLSLQLSSRRLEDVRPCIEGSTMFTASIEQTLQQLVTTTTSPSITFVQKFPDLVHQLQSLTLLYH